MVSDEQDKEGGDGEQQAVFEKPKIRRANIRRKTSADDGPDDVDDVRKVIEETRNHQKFRARGSGVDAEKLAGIGTIREIVEESGEVVNASMLDSQFSAENEGQTQYGLMEQHMMQFIDDKLSKKTEADPKEARQLTAEDELYVIPENLKLTKPDENIENGAETWLTGIVEVELPMDEKLRNIEETEKAKRKILEERRKGLLGSGFIVDTSSDKGYRRMDQKQKKQRGSKDSGQISDYAKRLSLLPAQGNFNANFVQHRPTREVKESAGNNPSRGGAGVRPELSSDDIVMERFKKRFRK